MISNIRIHPYFLTPKLSKPNYPFFVFLPGMDETGKELVYIQTAVLEAAFDVHCFVIPPDDLTNWDEMTEEVANLTGIELKKFLRRHVDTRWLMVRHRLFIYVESILVDAWHLKF
jgi:hypothetical protein